MMMALLNYQADDGMWRQLIYHSEAWKETSSTAMFEYAFIIGVKKGLLPKISYEKASQKAWNTLSGYVNSNGEVSDICADTDQSTVVNFYLTRPKVIGDLHGQAAELWFAYSLMIN